jgi:ribosomal-protein-alanine N-acetyltransferase
LLKILFAYAEKMELPTARLLLREVSSADLEAVHYLHSLPGVDEFNAFGIPDSLATTARVQADWLTQVHSTPRTCYVLAAQCANNQGFVGLIALTLGKASFRNAKVWYKFLPATGARG